MLSKKLIKNLINLKCIFLQILVAFIKKIYKVNEGCGVKYILSGAYLAKKERSIYCLKLLYFQMIFFFVYFKSVI